MKIKVFIWILALTFMVRQTAKPATHGANNMNSFFKAYISQIQNEKGTVNSDDFSWETDLAEGVIKIYTYQKTYHIPKGFLKINYSDYEILTHLDLPPPDQC